MKWGPIPTSAIMIFRMKPLARRHRIAHLRALIRRELTHSMRREELIALLRDEMSAQPGKQIRAM
jgi:hypothetical protein